MASKRLRSAKPSASKKSGGQRPLQIFDRPAAAPPRGPASVPIFDSPPAATAGTGDKYAPGHYDGDGCTFPAPGHLR